MYGIRSIRKRLGKAGLRTQNCSESFVSFTTQEDSIMMTEKEVWMFLHDSFAQECLIDDLPDDVCIRTLDPLWDAANGSFGFCNLLKEMRVHTNYVNDELVKTVMTKIQNEIRKVRKTAHPEDHFLFPTTREGAKQRQAFCLEQIAKLG